MNNINRAKLVSQKAHSAQSYDIYPYHYHTEMTAEIAEQLGFGEAIIIACHLHDTVEDGDLSYNKIKQAFGIEVAEIVYAVTDEQGCNREEKKIKTYPKIRALWKAVAVKICDRIANMRHSKHYNKGLYKMYVDEYDTFICEIYNPIHPQDELQKAWGLLAEVSGVVKVN